MKLIWKQNGTEFGETKEYGNFSFTRIYESGHEVPYYQPQAALGAFQRAIEMMDIASGKAKINGSGNNGGTKGQPKATHTESTPANAKSTSTASASVAPHVGRSVRPGGRRPRNRW
jgi:hypothetical protein